MHFSLGLFGGGGGGGGGSYVYRTTRGTALPQYTSTSMRVANDATPGYPGTATLYEFYGTCNEPVV